MPRRAISRFLWQTFYLLNWIVIVAFFLYTLEGSLFSEPSLALVNLGKLSGLVATYMVLTQFFLMGRFPSLERLWGLDGLSRFHQKNGRWSIVFLLLHPVFLVLGTAKINGLGLWAQFKEFFYNYPEVYSAVIGIVAFLFVIVFSYSVVRLKLRYETWFAVHLLAYLAVFMSFGHQFEVGSMLLANKAFYLYWAGLYILVFGMHLVFRILGPLYKFWKYRFRVSRVIRETSSTVSIYISGSNLKDFEISSGQFMIVRFLSRDLFLQSHPFSLSMMPNGRELRITVRELGDFTKKLASLASGTRVIIDGPYGVFTDLFSISKKVLMIAGGIGITPIRSLMEEMLSKGKDVVLLYGNRNENDIVFKKELEDLQNRYPSKIVFVMSDQDDYLGEKGKIDDEKIKRLVPDVSSREVYLCGPVPMMDGISRLLLALGVPEKMIHYEKFAF